MRQIIEIVKAIKGKKYIIASWCIIIINGLLPEWIWTYATVPLLRKINTL